MFRIPKEKSYTREELINRVSGLRKMSEKYFKRRGAVPAGRELFLNTGEGKVRVLGYNLENPAKLPLFVNIHGGGFIMGHPEMDDPYMMDAALNANVKILSVDYSLAPEAMFPKGLDECYAVLQYAQNHPEEFGIDSLNVSVGGHSAGGNFSAAICLKNAQTKELNIKCVILDYPPLDIYTDPYLKPGGKGMAARFFLSPERCRMFNECYCNKKEERKNPLISPVYASPELLKTFPPALILTAGKDSLCAEAEFFRDMLTKAGAEVTHKSFESSPHGFTLSQRPDAREGWQMMIDHLKHWLYEKP